MKNAKVNDSALILWDFFPTAASTATTRIFMHCLDAADNGPEKVYVHCFMDGRDTPPESGQRLYRRTGKMKEIGCGEIATVEGRYWQWTATTAGIASRKLTRR